MYRLLLNIAYFDDHVLYGDLEPFEELPPMCSSKTDFFGRQDMSWKRELK